MFDTKLFLLLLGVGSVWTDCVIGPGTSSYPTTITNPTGTITFDDLGFSQQLGWVYTSSPLTVYNANGITAVVTSPGGGAITKGGTGFAAGGGWTNTQPWATNDGNIGYYAQYNIKITFTPGVYSVSMRLAGETESSLIIYDESGNEISCHQQYSTPSSTNTYTVGGFLSLKPIGAVLLNGYLVADLIQFAKRLCTANSCDVNADCINNGDNTGVLCSCNTGWEGDGKTCTDTNECNTPNICQAHASCFNLPGTYNCTCDSGYLFNGTDCNDIDECQTETCGADATCKNLPGTFACVCNSGFEGDGYNCTDTDECLKTPCDLNARCDNSIGSFNCTCNEGYTGDGFTCQGPPMPPPIPAPVAVPEAVPESVPVEQPLAAPVKQPTPIGTKVSRASAGRVALVVLLASAAAVVLV